MKYAILLTFTLIIGLFIPGSLKAQNVNKKPMGLDTCIVKNIKIVPDTLHLPALKSANGPLIIRVPHDPENLKKPRAMLLPPATNGPNGPHAMLLPPATENPSGFMLLPPATERIKITPLNQAKLDTTSILGYPLYSPNLADSTKSKQKEK